MPYCGIFSVPTGVSESCFRDNYQVPSKGVLNRLSARALPGISRSRCSRVISSGDPNEILQNSLVDFYLWFLGKISNSFPGIFAIALYTSSRYFLQKIFRDYLEVSR